MAKLLFLATLLCVTLSIAQSKKYKGCYDGSDPFHYYSGMLNVTKSGKTCQRWDSDKPHNITDVKASDFPMKSLKKARNYCRNPGNPALRRPWCYTTDKKTKKEFCDLPLCKGLESCYFRHIRTYKGKVSKTETGKKCLRWDSRAVRRKKTCRGCKDVNNFPDATIKDANNYCRQPDEKNGFFRPWCFTSSKSASKKKKDWEYCKIPSCPDKCHAIVQDTHVEADPKDRIKSVKQNTRKECINLCKKTKDCYAWSYVGMEFSNTQYRKICFLRRKSNGMRPYKGISGGTRWVC